MNFGYELWLGRVSGSAVPLLSEKDMLPVRLFAIEDAIFRATRLAKSGDPETKTVLVYKRLGIEKAELVWSSDKALVAQ